MKKLFCLTVFCLCMVTGCLGGSSKEIENIQDAGETEDNISTEKQTENPPETSAENQTEEPTEYTTEEPTKDSAKQPASETETIRKDWSEYFDGINGAAVLYDSSDGEYRIYNQELAQTRRSPCSTFKIVSSLIALENGILDPAASTRKWSGEIFWNEAWNQDIDFEHAFRESCVWYFRELIDEIGQETIEEELLQLSYGNCDISDWEGRLNTNNNNRALTGFWIESSLEISPKEQVEVMEHIFGEDSVYSKESREQLKQVMSVSGENAEEPSIYGKTGMGKTEGVVVDAWYTGLAESEGRAVYFCGYL